MSTAMARVYYAHSLQIYGTEEAARAKHAIRVLLPDHEIFDPEEVNWKQLAAQHGQERIYESVIRFCTRVVVYEHQGFVGRGVAEEIWRAQHHKRPIHALRGLDATPSTPSTPVLIPVRGLVRANGDWKIRYAKLLV